MNRLRLFLLRWKMGLLCLWWMFKYRKEKLASVQVYLGSHFQSPHRSQLYYIIDGKPGPCYQSNFTNQDERIKTIFRPPCFKREFYNSQLRNGDHHILKIAGFSYVNMESGHSLMQLKKAYKGHNLKHLYNSVVRL